MIISFHLLALINNYACRSATYDDDGSVVDAYSVAKKAMGEFANKNIEKAEFLFNSNMNDYGNSMIFQQEYINFCIRIGKYENVISLKNITGMKNKSLVEEAKKYMKILESKNTKDIADLIKISPESKVILKYAIQYNIKEKNYEMALKYISQYENMYNADNGFYDLKVVVMFGLRRIEEGLSALSKINSKWSLYNDFSSIYYKYKSIRDWNTDRHMAKLTKLNELCNLALNYMTSTYNYNPNIYESLYSTILEQLVEYGCEIGYTNTISFANRLSPIYQSKRSIIYHIKAALLAKQVAMARNLLENNRKTLNHGDIINLERSIKFEEDKEKTRQEEIRKRKAEEAKRIAQEKERMLERYATNKAGRDFLGYYKVLGANKNSNEKEIKRLQRRAMKKASKNAKENMHLQVEVREAEMKKINKAYEVLSNSYKKKAYDLGIDPDSIPQDHGHQNYNNRGYQNVFQDADIEDILKTFFGSGGSRRRSGSHYQFFNFSS